MKMNYKILILFSIPQTHRELEYDKKKKSVK